MAPKSRPSQVPLSGRGALLAVGLEGAARFLSARGSAAAARGFSPAVGTAGSVGVPAPEGRMRSSGEEVPEVSALLLGFGLESSGIALV